MITLHLLHREALRWIINIKNTEVDYTRGRLVVYGESPAPSSPDPSQSLVTYPRETFLPWRWSLMILRYVHSRSDHVKGKTDSTFQTACKVNYPPGFSRVWQLRRACHDGLSFAVRDRSSLAPHCDVCSVGFSQGSRVAILPPAIYKHKYLRSRVETLCFVFTVFCEYKGFIVLTAAFWILDYMDPFYWKKIMQNAIFESLKIQKKIMCVECDVFYQYVKYNMKYQYLAAQKN
jgi:hypothetical protein